MGHIQLDERTRKLIEAAISPSEITQLCLKAGLTSGDLAKDGLGNVIVNQKSPAISQTIGIVDFDDRATMDGNNPPPSSVEFLK
jgi:hypothetical protein